MIAINSSRGSQATRTGVASCALKALAAVHEKLSRRRQFFWRSSVQSAIVGNSFVAAVLSFTPPDENDGLVVSKDDLLPLLTSGHSFTRGRDETVRSLNTAAPLLSLTRFDRAVAQANTVASAARTPVRSAVRRRSRGRNYLLNRHRQLSDWMVNGSPVPVRNVGIRRPADAQRDFDDRPTLCLVAIDIHVHLRPPEERTMSRRQLGRHYRDTSRHTDDTLDGDRQIEIAARDAQVVTGEFDEEAR